MLPSSKRPPRNYEEVIRTGDYEVIEGSPVAQARSSQRPVGHERAIDDERTQLFSGSGLPSRSGSPAEAQSLRAPRVPDMSLRGMVREGHEKPQVAEKTNLRGTVRPRPDAEDRTMLRPMGTIPSASPSSPAPEKGSPKPSSVRPPAMLPTPYVSMHSSPPAIAATVNAPGGSDVRPPAPSDPHGDPPSSVITARTRIVHARSTLSWAAGLVALGAIVGLVTAVVARGDADSIIDATATMVDPQHGTPERANGAAAQAAVLPNFVDAVSSRTPPASTDKNPGACLDLGASTVSAPVVLNTPPSATKGASTGSDPSTASRPAAPKPNPVAFARPRAAAPAPAQASPSTGWLANITPAGAGAPIARPSKAKNPGDYEGAAAADALAKAQLEQSLR